ncbi:endopeptidase La [Pseudomonadota bacterium]
MSEQEPIEPEIVSPGEGDALSTGLEVAAKLLPSKLFLLPVSDRPYFPAQSVPLLMNETPWLETLKHVGDAPQQVLGLLLSSAEDPEKAMPEDFASVGTVVRVHNPVRGDEKIQFIAEGVQRFRVVKWLSTSPPFEALVEYPVEQRPEDPDKAKAYAMAIIASLKELVSLNPLYSQELRMFLNRFSPNEPSMLTDFAASLTMAPKDELQVILETIDLCERMEKVLVLIKKELEVAKLGEQIREQVEETISEQQRKFFLREQLKAIQKELGIAKDDRTAEIERFKERLVGLAFPEEAQKRVDDEMEKLAILEMGSPEYSVTRNYLDWITVLPWGKYSKDKLNLRHARKILDQDHDGLDDVKDRIIEFLAVGAMKGEIAGSILLLVGPPGVGKTSIGRSVARALGRKFFRFSLGGMRDEAEIKGHRRTYIGAMPGKFIQALKDVGTANPVIMLDEIDKVGVSYQGDPASALLEVLDPEQNVDFLDHYLDVRFDLSKVLFMCTANQLDTVPSPLLDRTEIIRLGGYITEEKLAIAKHHLWPRQLEKAGLKSSQIKISDAALRRLIDGYAREAGVRNLEKQLGRIVRKAVVTLLSNKRKKGPVRVSVDQLEEYLGKPFFAKEKPLRGVGVVTGLAWTAMGGVTLSVEATQIHGKGRGFKLTGQLGGVMKESAEIAYSYVSSHVEEFGAKADFFDQAFLHLHVPAGATPKDGPSAGVTMATALLSLARGQRVKRPMAMTGELTLTGHVFPVGGIREKVIAARRAKIKELILPEANRGDFEELPDHIREGVTVHFVTRFQEVVPIAFGS